MRMFRFILICSLFSFVSFSYANSLSPYAYKKLQAVQKLIEEDAWIEAKAQLLIMEEELRSDFAKAIVRQTLGQVAVHEDDYPTALAYLTKAYEAKLLDDNNQQSLLHGIAQLHCGIEEWRACQTKLQSWIASNTQKARATDYVMLAQAFMATEDWAAMVPPLQTALSKRERAPIDWYRMLVAAQVYQEHWKEAVKAQRRLVNHYGDKAEEWRRLASFYMQLGDHKGALDSTRLPYQHGLEQKEQDYKRLAQLMNQDGMPYKAAIAIQEARKNETLEGSISNLQLEGALFAQAKEYEQAAAVFEELLKRAPKVTYVNKLVEIYFESQEWAAVEVLLKPWLKKHSDNYLQYMLAISYVNRHEFDKAKQAFAEMPSDHAQVKSVESWLKYIAKVQAAS